MPTTLISQIQTDSFVLLLCLTKYYVKKEDKIYVRSFVYFLVTLFLQDHSNTFEISWSSSVSILSHTIVLFDGILCTI